MAFGYEDESADFEDQEADEDAPEAEEAPQEPYDSTRNYWAAAPTDQIGCEIGERVSEYYRGMQESGLIDLYDSVHTMFYGLSPGGTHETSSIFEFGADGEKLGVRSNQLRSLVRYVQTSVTADRPALLPKAVNTTAKALAQVPTARRVLEYYHRRKHLEKRLRGVVLRALLYGKGYLWQAWDPNLGPQTTHTEQDPESGTQLERQAPEGDLLYKACSPLEVSCDLERDEDDHDWFVIRRARNKYDAAAVYAGEDEELRVNILEVSSDCVDESVASSIAFGFRRKDRSDSDTIFEYHFIHRKTPALPDGRYVIMVGEDMVLFDGPLPYDDLPISEMVPEEFLGAGSVGYSSAWDLLGLQQAYDGLLSIALTNADAFGYNDILLPDGVELGVEEVRDGLNVIRFPAGEFNRPSVLEKLSIKEELFKLRDVLKSDMETNYGVNSVARGEPEASLKSGAALALVQAQAIHFQNSTVAAYVNLVEDSGTKTIRILKRYATTARIGAIAGANDPDGLTAFKSTDIDQIDRIEVEQVNPLFRTHAGKLDMANNLLERGLIQDVSQYFQVIESGRQEPVTDPMRQEHVFAESVREKLMSGPAVKPKMDPATGQPKLDPLTTAPIMEVDGLTVTIMDNPMLCIRAAKSVLDSIENRTNDAVVIACTTYAANVLTTWKSAPKELLNLLGYPLPPPLPGDPDYMDPNAEQDGGPGGQDKGPPKKNTPPNGKGEQADQQAPDQGSGMPSLPKPAKDPLAGQR